VASPTREETVVADRTPPSGSAVARAEAEPASPSPRPALAQAVVPARRTTDDGTSEDERRVLGMYQDMADAVDVYGTKDCAVLGRAFEDFAADGAEALYRVVRADRAEGPAYEDHIFASHGQQLDAIRAKLRVAFARCSGDPSVFRAFQSLSHAG
jgi:hypothetical protein